MIISTATTLLFLCSFAGCCKFLITFVQDIKEQLKDLNKDVRKQSKIFTIQKDIEVKKKLCRIIQCHGDAKELSLRPFLLFEMAFMAKFYFSRMNHFSFNDCNRIPFLIHFQIGWQYFRFFLLEHCNIFIDRWHVCHFNPSASYHRKCIDQRCYIWQPWPKWFHVKIAIKSDFFLFEQAFKSGNIMELIRSLMLLSSTYLWIFGFCYFGEQVTSAFNDLHKTVYLCDWYSFPLKIRKFIPTILLNAQQPVHMRGFASFNCTLQTFKTVINTSYEYFATLKEIIWIAAEFVCLLQSNRAFWINRMPEWPSIGLLDNFQPFIWDLIHTSWIQAYAFNIVTTIKVSII